MARAKNIWVLPEINGDVEEISRLSLGLLTEARCIAADTGGVVTALVFGDRPRDYSDVFGKYGIARSYIFHDPLLQNPSAEAYAVALLPRIQSEKPWLLIMGHTSLGMELAPRLAAFLDTAAVSNCARIDLTQPEKPGFYRSAYADQFYQEIALRTDKTMLVTLAPLYLNVTAAAETVKALSLKVETGLVPESIKTRHLEYLPADFQTVDVADADTIVSVGMGAATDELLPAVEELATLLEGAIGTTRPVVDGGKIPRERMIGQTGKVVNPEFYLALGISGATHHVGGIQESGKIVSINRDPQAPIFKNSDFGISADLKDVLPELIDRIKRAKNNGEIL